MGISSGVKVRWLGDSVVDKVDRRMTSRLQIIGEVVASYVRREISTPTRTEGPSGPGEKPHADTGHLRKSITWELSQIGDAVRIGTNVEYARALEQGFPPRNLAPRPFLEISVEELMPRIERILKRPL